MTHDLYDELMLPLYRRLDEIQEAACIERGQSLVSQHKTNSRGTEKTDAQSVVFQMHQQAQRELQAQLLAHIYAQDPRFFETLIIDLLLAMGYGGRRRDLVKRLGRSHDGGIDGVVKQDELGLDLIMLQAKRFKPGTTVSASQLRDFAGGLEAARAAKGIFFTTADFSAQARAVAQTVSRRIVLVNGAELTSLMIRHGIGVRINESFVFKTLEKSYFSAARGG